MKLTLPLESSEVLSISLCFLLTSRAGHSSTVNAVQFSPRHRGLLATVSDDQNVRLWSAPNDPEIQDLSEPFLISTVAGSENGNDSNSNGMSRLQRFQEMMLLGEPIN
jgi:WD40 repeat protein